MKQIIIGYRIESDPINKLQASLQKRGIDGELVQKYSKNSVYNAVFNNSDIDTVIVSYTLEASNHYNILELKSLQNLHKERSLIVILSNEALKRNSNLMRQFYNAGIYNVIYESDATIENLCNLIQVIRSAEDAAKYYGINPQITNMAMNSEKLKKNITYLLASSQEETFKNRLDHIHKMLSLSEFIYLLRNLSDETLEKIFTFEEYEIYLKKLDVKSHKNHFLRVVKHDKSKKLSFKERLLSQEQVEDVLNVNKNKMKEEVSDLQYSEERKASMNYERTKLPVNTVSSNESPVQEIEETKRVESPENKKSTLIGASLKEDMINLPLSSSNNQTTSDDKSDIIEELNELKKAFEDIRILKESVSETEKPLSKDEDINNHLEESVVPPVDIVETGAEDPLFSPNPSPNDGQLVEDQLAVLQECKEPVLAPMDLPTAAAELEVNENITSQMELIDEISDDNAYEKKPVLPPIECMNNLIQNINTKEKQSILPPMNDYMDIITPVLPPIDMEETPVFEEAIENEESIVAVKPLAATETMPVVPPEDVNGKVPAEDVEPIVAEVWDEDVEVLADAVPAVDKEPVMEEEPIVTEKVVIDTELVQDDEPTVDEEPSVDEKPPVDDITIANEEPINNMGPLVDDEPVMDTARDTLPDVDVVPDSHKEIVINENAVSDVSESNPQISLSMENNHMQPMQRKEERSIAVVGLSSEVGTSFSSINIAKILEGSHGGITILDIPNLTSNNGIYKLCNLEDLLGSDYHSHQDYIVNNGHVKEDYFTLDGIRYSVKNPCNHYDWDISKTNSLLDNIAGNYVVDCGSNLEYLVEAGLINKFTDIVLVSTLSTLESHNHILNLFKDTVVKYNLRCSIILNFAKAEQVRFAQRYMEGIPHQISIPVLSNLEDNIFRICDEDRLTMLSALGYEHRKESSKKDIPFAVKQLGSVEIGFVGVNEGVGTTHSAILCANALKDHYKVCVVELNTSGHFQKIRASISKKGKYTDNSFNHMGIDFYHDIPYSEFNSIHKKNYDFIIADFGHYGTLEDMNDLMRCDKKCIIGQSNDWKVREIENAYYFFLHYDVNHDWSYMLPLSQEDCVCMVKKYICPKNKVYSIPLCLDVYQGSTDTQITFRKMLGLPAVFDKKAKKL